MNLRNFRFGWRALTDDPGYSAVAVCGLAAGLATFFLLLSWVGYSFSYDAHVPDAQRVFVLKHRMNLLDKPELMELMPLPFKAATERSGLAESVAATVELPGNVRVDGRTRHVPMLAVDPAFAPMFGVAAIQGDLGAALTRPDTVVLTVSTATALFGERPAMGQILHVDGKSLTVAALVPDPPTNTTVPYSALVGINSAAWPDDQRKRALNTWGHLGGKIYVKLVRASEAPLLADALQAASDRSPFLSQLPAAAVQRLGEKRVMDVVVGNLRDAYFDPDVRYSKGSGARASKEAVLGAAAVGALVLALAMMNYVNLAAVRTIRRQREIALRKLLGASARRVVGMFMLESCAITGAAALLGLVLAALLQPRFGELVNRQLEPIASPGFLLMAAGVALLAGMIAGAYPAWAALKVRAGHALAGRGDSEAIGAGWMRRALTVLQCGTAMALCSVALAVSWQTNYANAMDPGFDPGQFMVLDLPENLTAPRARALRDALARLPGTTVAAAMDSAGRSAPMIGWESRVQRNTGTDEIINVQDVSANYFATYAVEPLAGQWFTSANVREEAPNSVVLNAAAVRLLGFASPQEAVGKLVSIEGTAGAMTIAAVAPGMGRESLHQAQRPLIYRPGLDTGVLIIRSAGDLTALGQAIHVQWQRYYPDEVVALEAERSFFRKRYADDAALATLLGIATLVAGAIAGFGIYVLAAYSVQRRSKLIILHKLFGAPRRAVAWLVGREFAVLVGAGALLGMPLAAMAIQHYLSRFVTHAPGVAWTLPLACVLSFAVAAAATGRHLTRALRMAPAQVLRH